MTDLVNPTGNYPLGENGNEVPVVISNKGFGAELQTLRKLRHFVVNQGIKDKSKEPPTRPDVALGQLETVLIKDREADASAREPSAAEWDQLNLKLQYFYGLLSEPERRKFNFMLAAPRLKVMPTSLVAASIVF